MAVRPPNFVLQMFRVTIKRHQTQEFLFTLKQWNSVSFATHPPYKKRNFVGFLQRLISTSLGLLSNKDSWKLRLLFQQSAPPSAWFFFYFIHLSHCFRYKNVLFQTKRYCGKGKSHCTTQKHIKECN